MISLRPYQEKEIHELRECLRRGLDPLLVAPCGSGKGSLIAYMVHRAVERGKRVLFAVYGKSLVVDMSQRVDRLGIKHGVLLGGKKRERWHSVQVASIDTLHRMEDPPQVDLAIIDEADLAVSPTWKKALSRHSGRIVGMTATPVRLDGKGLGKKSGGLFDAMILGPTEAELIKDGYLVGSHVLAPPPPPDLGRVKKTASEFDIRQMAQVCDKSKIIGDVVEHWKKHSGGGKTVTFAIDQAHAQHVGEQFRLAGFSWAYVDADTPLGDPKAPEPGTRAAIWRDLDYGDLRGVVSVGCTSVGWDHSIVSCVVALRKTASLRLWKQQLGRGSRIHPGKKFFTVIDHCGNTAFHEPYGCFEDAIPWSLDGEAVASGPSEKQERYVTCKVPAMVDGALRYPCYAVFKAGPPMCPYCGIPLVKQVAKVEVEEGELQEYKRLENVTYAGSTGTSASMHRMRVFQSLIDDARQRPRVHDKTAWAVQIFKERFGVAPPREWVPGFVAPVTVEPITGDGLEL
jgi:DNA repair protein RadD